MTSFKTAKHRPSLIMTLGFDYLNMPNVRLRTVIVSKLWANLHRKHFQTIFELQSSSPYPLLRRFSR